MGLFNNSSKSLEEAIETRRTIYHIEPKSTIKDEEIEEIIAHTLKHVPSAFNSQSTRIVLLLNDEHKKLWDITKDILKEKMGPERDFSQTEQKLNSFKAGYGTVLFFEDDKTVNHLKENFQNYADKFSDWSHHTNAIHQYVIWTKFATVGLGASLQHYNPIIDDKVKAAFDIPQHWTLVAEMPFGTIGSNAAPKEFKPVESRMIVRK